MRKHFILTSLLAIVATCGAANATIEGTEAAQIKANLETEFKTAPDMSDYALTAPDGTDSTLADVVASDYTNYAATTSADGTNVVLNDGIVLNIAQGTVAATNYKYASKDEDGVVTMVAGGTTVDDLSKDYTSAYITTPISVSTTTTTAPVIDLGSDASDAIYITGDGNYYLLRVGDDILLNGDPDVTADNPSTYQTLLAAYNADADAISALHTTLVGYKAENTTNAAAVTTVVDADNSAIAAIVANQSTFTAQNTQYTSDAAENTAYVNSLAQTIDMSIAAGTNDAKLYADGLAVNYDAAGAADTAETNAKSYADGLAVNYDAAGAADAAEANAKAYADAGDELTLASAKSYADAGDELTLNAAKSYADQSNALTLNQAKAYTDERIEKLDKDLSAGVASAVALSSVSVSNVKRGEVSVGGGYGYFNGQSAAAFGAAMGLSDRWSVNAGAGVSSADVAFRAGTNYKFKLF